MSRSSRSEDDEEEEEDYSLEGQQQQDEEGAEGGVDGLGNEEDALPGGTGVKANVYTKDYDLHLIRFPTKERLVDVEAPLGTVLSDSEFWLPDGKPNCLLVKEHLRREGKVSIPQLVILIDQVHELFCAEENVLEVDAPVTVCGDVHGQYYDLLKLLEVGGDPSCTNYLFMGDYVDRGLFSMECIILLFCYKLSYPNSFFMLRGNHECRHLTDYFTFREETEHKYSREIYDSLMDCFDALPLAAIMNKQFFCVHGGLSPELETLEDIRFIERFCEPPPAGAMCDLLWADPMENFGETESQFEFNSVRGCSYNFGFNAVCDFLERNGLLSVIRAHEAQDAGYKMHKRNERTGFPSVITLFSAPNYLDSYNNKGALMRYENNIINIRQFNASPHPYILPAFMNVFNWSLPFVAEKITEMINVILNLVDDKQAEQQEIDRKKAQAERERKREALRSKLRTVSRMLTLYKKMRIERETRLSLASSSSPKPEEEKLNVARPPGLISAIEAAKIEPRTPEGIRRRQSRDKILSHKKQLELQKRFPMQKVYDAKDFDTPNGPTGDKSPQTSEGDGIRPLRFASLGELPHFGSDPSLPSPALITTSTEGQEEVFSSTPTSTVSPTKLNNSLPASLHDSKTASTSTSGSSSPAPVPAPAAVQDNVKKD